MPDQFTEVTHKSWFSNIMDSIKGVFFGIILFVLSFVVLWINEGRINMSKIAKTSIAVSSNIPHSWAEGKLVSVTGELSSSESIGDPKYLQLGPYIKLIRNVEMFAWDENKSTKSKKELGGGTTEYTTYSYHKKWSSHPNDSSGFKYPDGHENPPMVIRNNVFIVTSAKVGIYDIDPQSIVLPAPVDVELTPERVILEENEELIGNYIFNGKGSLHEPEIGDIRVSFRAVDKDTKVTVFGKLKGEQIVPFMYKDKYKLYRALRGERDEAIAQMVTEHRLFTWLLRIIGFLMMWFGLYLFFGPINAVLDVFPILGSVGRGIVGIVMFIVAFILSILTIVVSMIAHNIIALIVVLAILFAGVLYWSQLLKSKS